MSPETKEFDNKLSLLEEKVGYSFKNRELLKEALTHRSYLLKHPNIQHNARLEFLGKAFISSFTAEYLFKRFPNEKEGSLTRMRSAICCNQNLTQISSALSIGECMRLGPGESVSNLGSKVLGGSYAALIGAIYLDGGEKEGRRQMLNHFSQQIEQLNPTTLRRAQDIKLQLQLHLRQRGTAHPTYEIFKEEGPVHNPTFFARVWVEGVSIAEGSGPSKRAAELAAASNALERIMKTGEGCEVE